MEYLKILNNFMKEESNSHNMILKGKIISLIDALKYNKGVVITGPRCSGKTSIIKGLGYLLKNSDINTDMRISIMNPDVYNIEKLYGTAESGVMNPEISTNKDVKISSISSTVLEIALKGFEMISENEGKTMVSYIDNNDNSDEGEEIERPIDVSSQDSGTEDQADKPKLLKTLLFESSAINPLWADCLLHYIKEANYITDLFSPLITNNLERTELMNKVEVTFPNGASTHLPRDILLMFECDNIRDASPTFISSTMLVYTEDDTLKWKELFSKEKAKVIKMLKKKPFVGFKLWEHFEAAFKDFVVPFISKLCETRVQSEDFWQMKSLTVRFFKLLDGLLANLGETERRLRKRDDPVFLPIKSQGDSLALNLTLMAVVWTFGAILNQEMRVRFEDTFLQYKRKFDLNLSGNLNSGGLGLSKNTKVSLFEMYFDLERLQWDLVAERMGTRVSEGYQARNNKIVIPSLEMSQIMLLFDTLMTNRKYNIQIEGKTACQKTTVLTNLSHKLRMEYRSFWIPMTISNSIEKSRKMYEQFYKTSENRFIMTPIDHLKPLLIIDDLHLEDNMNSSFSDFFRMWDSYGGYYHLESGQFINFDELRLL